MVYIGNTASVIRLPYKNGDLEATGPAQTIIPEICRTADTRPAISRSLSMARGCSVRSASRPMFADVDTVPAETRAPTFSNTRRTAVREGLRLRNPQPGGMRQIL